MLRSNSVTVSFPATTTTAAAAAATAACIVFRNLLAFVRRSFTSAAVVASLRCRLSEGQNLSMNRRDMSTQAFERREYFAQLSEFTLLSFYSPRRALRRFCAFSNLFAVRLTPLLPTPGRTTSANG